MLVLFATQGGMRETEIRTLGAWCFHLLQNNSQNCLLLENIYCWCSDLLLSKTRRYLFDATSREMPQTGGGTLSGGSLLWMTIAMITVSSTLVFYNSR